MKFSKSNGLVLKTSAILSAIFFLTSCTGSNSSTKIIGGELAENPGHFVTIHTKYDSKGKNPTCGGTLIREDIVITAAHCLNILTGKIKFEQGGKSKVYNIKTKTKHEGYNNFPTIENDVAIAFIEPISKEDFPSLKFAKLNRNFIENLPGRNGTAYGVGNLTSVGSAYNSNELRKIDLPLAPLRKCQKGLEPVSPALKLKNTHLCVFTGEGGRDTCQGDSGGPLLSLKNKNILVGITSFGVSCAQKGQGAIFTKVSSFYSWITQKIKHYDSNFIGSIDSEKEVKSFLKNKLSVHCNTISSETLPVEIKSSTTSENNPVKRLKYQYLMSDSSIEGEVDQSNGKIVESIGTQCEFKDETLGEIELARYVSDPIAGVDDSSLYNFVLNLKSQGKSYHLKLKTSKEYALTCDNESFGTVDIDFEGDNLTVSGRSLRGFYTKNRNLLAPYFAKTHETCDFEGLKVEFEHRVDSDGVLKLKSLVTTNSFGFKTKYDYWDYNIPQGLLETRYYEEGDKNFIELSNPLEADAFGLIISCDVEFKIKTSSKELSSTKNEKEEYQVYLNHMLYPEGEIKAGETKSIEMISDTPEIKCKINSYY